MKKNIVLKGILLMITISIVVCIIYQKNYATISDKTIILNSMENRKLYQSEIIQNTSMIENLVNIGAVGSFNLGLTANTDGYGSVSLDWSNYNYTNKNFKVYKSSDGGVTYETVGIDYTTVSEVRVLNIYPAKTSGSWPVEGTITFKSSIDGKTYTLPKSASLKMWMEAANSQSSNGFGKGIIKVTPVTLSSFNSNPSAYLYDSSGNFKYDVIVYGTWNGNAGEGFNENASRYIEKWLKSGKGFLAGHDTFSASPTIYDESKDQVNAYYFNNLRNYFGITASGYDGTEPTVNYGTGDGTGSTTDTIEITKKGLFTNYPWYIGEVGTKLVVPSTHTTNGLRYTGDVWLKWKDGPTNSENVFLSTKNNTAAIQTGDANCVASLDEQKILANIIFYLNQLLFNEYKTRDNSAQDFAKPNATSIRLSGNTYNFSATDNGSTYSYYVESYSKDDTTSTGIIDRSVTKTLTVTTGVKSYRYIYDNTANTTVTLSNGTSATSSTNINTNYKYLHVAAVDGAGNIGPTTTIEIPQKADYKVYHQQEQLNGTYTTVSTETFNVAIGASVTPGVKTYVGFSSPSTQTVSIKADGTTSVTYKYSRNSYTVTLNKGKGISDVSGNGSYKYEESVTINAIISDGYTWSNWSGTKATATKQYTFTMPASNVENTANTKANTYTVVYNGNNSTGGSTTSSTHTYDVEKALTANGFERKYTVTYNHNYTGSTNASKTATYTFNGWATSFGGAKVYNDKQNVKNLTTTNNATINLYANWSSNSVSYTPTRTGYIFGGWYKEASCTNQVTTASNTTYTPSENTTLYAKWIPITYTVAYNGNSNTGGSTASSTHTYDVEKALTANGFERKYTVTYNHNYTGSTNASKTATYTFNGWATSSGGAKVYNNSQNVINLTTINNGTLNLYAKWSANSVSYTPTRTGYIFGGWYKDVSCTNQATPASNTTYTPSENITLYAKWIPITYTVVYNGNSNTGGSTASSTHTYDVSKNLTANGFERKYTVTYNHNYTGSTNASKTASYTFNGWATSASGSKVYNNSQSVKNLSTTNNGTVNLYANWSSNSVSYTPTRTGYIFEGWYTTSNGTGSRVDTNGIYTPSQDITLYAKWTPITYTVVYNGNSNTGGNTASSTHTYDVEKALTANGFERKYTVTYNHNYTGSTNASKTATYTFNGWATSSGGAKVYNDKQNVKNLTTTNNATINLYANWSSNSVSYTPTRTGYIFGGWYADASCTNQITTAENTTYTPSQDVTLYAKWIPITYTIKYHGNKATEGNTEDSIHTYDEEKSLNENEYKRKYVVTYNHNYEESVNENKTAEYIYKGWSTELNGAKVYDNKQSVINLTTKDKDIINLYAIWESTSVEYTPTRTGYKFGGWYKEASCTNQVTSEDDTTYIPTEDITLYAKWIPITYTIKYHGNKATEGNTEDSIHTYDEEKTLTPNGFIRKYNVTYDLNFEGTTKINKTAEYIYKGWALSEGGEKVYDDKQSIINLTIIDKDIINLYAVWESTSVEYTPIRVGYKFCGWYKEPECINQVTSEDDTTYIPTENTTLYAKWKIVEYTIRYNGNGATEGKTENSYHTYGIEKELTPNEYKRKYQVAYNHNYAGSTNLSQTAEYRYVGWANSEYERKVYDDRESVVNLTIKDRDIVNLYAVWEPRSVNYIPTRTGYTFIGWYKEAECINQLSTGEFMPIEDTTLYAKWEKNTYKYTIEYYYDGVKDDSKTIIKEAKYQEVIHEFEDKKIPGYRLMITEEGPDAGLEDLEDGTIGISLTISEKEEENIIKVYYVKDNGQTKDLSYTVEYYKNNEIVEEDTKVVSKTVYILNPDTIKVNKGLIVPENKYFGYKLSNIDEIPELVNNGDVIKLYYVIDESQTKKLSYTVEYYKNGEIVEEDTKVVKQNVQVLQADTLNLDESAIANEKYNGYKIERTEPEELQDIVNNGDVIKIYYVIDESQTKELSYTVEYYKDGEKVKEDTKVVKETVQVLQDDKLNLDKSAIANEKYNGYKIEKTEPEEIPDVVNSGDIIKVYYVIDESQTKELSYTVEYYKDGEKIEEDTIIVKESVQVLSPDTLKVDKSLIDNIDKYPGYGIEKTRPEVIAETVNNGAVIKVYYVKGPIRYTIRYYYDGVLNESETEVGYATLGDIIETYQSKEKYGYEFEKVESLPLTITAESGKNTIKVYYTRKTAEVEIKFTDKVTGQEIKTEKITGKVFDRYDVSYNTEIPGYTLVEVPTRVTGTFTEEKQVKEFYYAKNTSVIVKYLEQDETLEDNSDNTIIAESDVIEGYEGKEYITSPKEIEGYSCVGNSENTTGKMIVDPITEVVYYYEKNGKVTVNHIDKNTGDILETTEHEGKVGSTYTSKPKDFDNYILDEGPEDETVVMTREDIVLNYYYVQLSAGVIEKHIDIKTNEILEQTLYEGKEGDEYTTESKEFEGYDLVEEEYPEKPEGTMEVELIEVKYYYIRKTSVIVKYVDKATSEEILENNIAEAEGTPQNSTEYIYGHEGDEYKAKEKEFEGYDLVEVPENAEGIMKVTLNEDGSVNTELEVIYYYARKAEVIERHINIKTEELLEEETRYEGHEGDEYKTQEKEFEGYDLVEEKYPENNSGTMSTDTIIVNYYYIRKVKVVVEHVDIETGDKIAEDEIIEGHEGDEYHTQSKDIEDFKLSDKIPENQEGVMEDKDIVVTYYYEKIEEEEENPPIDDDNKNSDDGDDKDDDNNKPNDDDNKDDNNNQNDNNNNNNNSNTNDVNNNVTNNSNNNNNNNNNKSNNTSVIVVNNNSNSNNKVNTTSSSTNTTSKNSSTSVVPNTGDILVVIAIGTIGFVSILNVIVTVWNKKKK